MNHQSLKLILLASLIAATSAGGGYWIARHQALPAPEATSSASPTPNQKPLYWYDPMVPDQHFDKPGKSPFMDMQLVPKYADAGGASGGIAVDNAMAQNIGIRYASVEHGSLAQPLTVPASIAFNEREVAIVQARTSGFVERVYALAAGDVIASGAPLVDLLVPDWAGAQAEFLALRQTGDASLTQAARIRLRLLGMPESLIQQVEKSGQVRNTVTVTAPLGGVIQSLDIRTGMTVNNGMSLARINGLRTVWLEAALPEAQAGQVKLGQSAVAHLAAYPEQPLSGKVIAILPEVNAQSRTLRIRLEFPNPRSMLRPGLFAQVQLATDTKPEALLIPSEALIHTAERAVVIQADDQGRFHPVTVMPGTTAGDKTEILSGLKAGDKVVASGQFLIDSEASLQGVLARMENKSAGTAPPPAHTTHPGTGGIESRGVIEAVNQTEITLSHEPIPALDWPSMTMTFPVAPGVSTTGLHPGQHVRFTLVKQDESQVVVRIQPQGDRP